jgi:hypothetical protein
MQDLTHGFLYDGQTWTYLDCPGAAFTTLLGGDGTSFVGRTDLGAFIYTIPEPATLLLLTLGGLMLKKRR